MNTFIITRSLTLLVSFTHLPLYNSMPMAEVMTSARGSKSAALMEGSNAVHFVQVNPTKLDSAPASLLPPTAHLPKTPTAPTTEPVSLNHAKSTGVAEDEELFYDARSSFEDKDDAINPPSSEASDASPVTSPKSNQVHSSFDLNHKTLEGSQAAAGPVSIYHRLLSQLSEPPPLPDKTLSESISKSPVSSNARQLLQSSAELLSSSKQLVSSAATRLASLVRGDPLKQEIPPNHLVILKSYLFHDAHMDLQVATKYYHYFAGENTKSTAMIEFNPAIHKQLTQWKKDNLYGNKLLEDGMVQILTQSEFDRRSRILKTQANQFMISKGWDSAIKTISAETGYKPEVVSSFGNKLGGKEFFTSFKDYDFEKNLAELRSFQQGKGKLKKAWENYLGKDYDSRVHLLETLSQMKHPDAVSSELISAWRAQELDVDRMLKIVDYIQESFKNLPTKEKFLPTHFKDQKDSEMVFKLTRDVNSAKIPWSESLEHNQLMQLPSDIRDRYVQLRRAARRHSVKAPENHVQLPPATDSVLKSDEMVQMTRNKPWWKNLLSRTKNFFDRLLKGLPWRRTRNVGSESSSSGSSVSSPRRK